MKISRAGFWRDAVLAVFILGGTHPALAAPPADAYEPDNSSSTARKISNGQLQHHTIHKAGNADWVKLRANGFGIQSLKLQTAGPSGDTQMWLYGGAGTLLAYNDNGGSGNFSKIQIPALAPRTYYLKIREKGNNGTIPAYTLKANWIAATTTVDVYEPDESRNKAKLIANGQTQTRSIHTPGNSDMVRFQISNLNALDVVIQTAGSVGDTEMWLFRADGSQLAFDDDSGPALFSRINVNSLAPGIYYIKVREYHNNGTIPAYTLSLNYTAPITNIDEFLKTCPTADPAFSQIHSDFKIRRNGVLVTTFPCSGSPATMPIAAYTDELIVLQGLRVLYYMDRGQSNHLPWTSLTLYNWMKSKIKGINIADGGLSHCCDIFDGETYITIVAQDDFNRDYDRAWEGICGNIGLYAHETRHADGYGHVSCCGIAGGCDNAYNESDLTPYGIQWWLERAWLNGTINVGIGCLSSSRRQTIANWHLGSCNGLRTRFCNNEPPVLSLPSQPGGPCPQ